MSFHSFSEFLAMGGHALYVWLSYGVTLVVMASILLQPLSQRRQLVRDLAQRQRREERKS